MLLIKEAAYVRLGQAGIHVKTGPARMEDWNTHEVRPDYQRIADLEIIRCMAVQTLEFTESKKCPECGLRVMARPTRLFLRQDHLPATLPLFMLEETASIISNEPFAKAVKDIKLTNIRFEPVELV